MPKPLLLSICIPTRNRPRELGQTLKALLTQLRVGGESEGVEIIVSDNTDDETLMIAPEELRSAAVRYIRNEGNLGYARNINKLITSAAGKYVWLLSDDDFVQDGAVGEILSALAAPEEINYLTFFTGAAFNGRTFSDNFYFSDLSGYYFRSGNDFLAKYLPSVIFVSCNVFDREKMLKHAAETGFFEERNDVYQNSLLCISFIFKCGCVKIIKKLLLVDNYGNKAYSRTTALETPVHQYIKLWVQLEPHTGRRAIAPLLRDVASSVLTHGLRFAVHRAEGASDFDYMAEFRKITSNGSLPLCILARANFVCFLLRIGKKSARAALKLIAFSRIIRLDYNGLKAEALAFEADEKQQRMRSVY